MFDGTLPTYLCQNMVCRLDVMGWPWLQNLSHCRFILFDVGRVPIVPQVDSADSCRIISAISSTFSHGLVVFIAKSDSVFTKVIKLKGSKIVEKLLLLSVHLAFVVKMVQISHHFVHLLLMLVDKFLEKDVLLFVFCVLIGDLILLVHLLPVSVDFL